MKNRPLKSFIFILILFSFACRAAVGIPTNTPPMAPSTPLPATNSQIELSPTQTGEQIGGQVLLPLNSQLDILKDLWQVVDENYLYEDFNGLDWDQSYLDLQLLIKNGLSDEAFYEQMYEMIYSLGDEHSVYLNPIEVADEEAEYEGNSDYGGIGIWVTTEQDREIAVILLIFNGSPAEAAGLKPHDSILFVEGLPVLDEEGYLTDGMLGIPGTTVTITIQSPGEQPRDIQLVREKILASFPVKAEIITSPEGMKIAYIFIPTFSEQSIGTQMAAALKEMGEVDGVILDNRFNGGGFDNVMSSTLSPFVGGTVGHFVNRTNEEAFKITPKNINQSQDIPLVVLVGEGTASFGEIFSGILQDQKRAYLIGETTDGNVETLWGYDFADGSRAWIAHDVFIPINHPQADWEEFGIIPDLEVISEWDLFTLETDPVILAALDYFEGMD